MNFNNTNITEAVFRRFLNTFLVAAQWAH